MRFVLSYFQHDVVARRAEVGEVRDRRAVVARAAFEDVDAGQAGREGRGEPDDGLGDLDR